jgi:hypothetical protein
MANIRNLKKDINYVLGDIIEAVYIWEYSNTSKDTKKSEAIIDDAISTFDELIAKINAAHFKSIQNELEEKGRALVDRINKL